MQKKLSKILISVIMLGIFLLPLTANIGIKNAELVAKIEVSKLEADNHDLYAFIAFGFVQSSGTSYPIGYYTFPTLNACNAAKATVSADSTTDCQLTSTLLNNPLYKNIPNLSTVNKDINSAPKKDDSRVYFGCVSLIFDFASCLVSASYYLIFMPISGLTALAAGVLDFFIFYSTSDDAYNDVFVTKAWGAVRDIANIFFIIALLYIAIKTILNLGNSNSKKLLTYVIIVALVINFSLFFTKVVIDASNVIAKIFYHQITP